MQIVRNQSLNWVNRNRSRRAQARELENADTVLMKSLQPTEKMFLEKILLGLPQIQRKILLLHDMEGWNHTEIASVMGMPEATSRWHLYSAKQAIRKQLDMTSTNGRRDVNGK
jgi:RNA polymerase sigma-70 factor (ECF subfamily)